MAWDAILHGAKGILYWGSYMVNSKSLFWKSILGVTKEIAALEPFLLGNELKEKIKTLGMNPLFVPSLYFKVDELPKLGTGKADFKGSKTLALTLDKNV